jgi:hypothetical protein
MITTAQASSDMRKLINIYKVDLIALAILGYEATHILKYCNNNFGSNI